MDLPICRAELGAVSGQGAHLIRVSGQGAVLALEPVMPPSPGREAKVQSCSNAEQSLQSPPSREPGQRTWAVTEPSLQPHESRGPGQHTGDVTEHASDSP